MFCADRSLHDQRHMLGEGTGLPKRWRSVPVGSETRFAGGYWSVEKAETGPFAYFANFIKGVLGIFP